MNSDEFAAREQLAHVESDAVRQQLASGRLGGLDLTMPIRTPSQDRGRDTTHFNIRAATWLVSGIDDICGREAKFKNRSEFMRHYMVVGLALERELGGYNPDMDPVVTKAKLENEKQKLVDFDSSVELASELYNTADGDPERQKYLAELRSLRCHAEEHGQIERMSWIDGIISGTGFYGRNKHAR